MRQQGMKSGFFSLPTNGISRSAVIANSAERRERHSPTRDIGALCDAVLVEKFCNALSLKQDLAKKNMREGFCDVSELAE